jgi:hypothetical protein
MGLYSTIDDAGIVIDLTEFAAVFHDKTRREAVLTGGVTSKAVAVVLAKEGHCASKSVAFLDAFPELYW